MIPMAKKSNENFRPAFSARPHSFIFGLAVYFAVAPLFPLSFAQRAVRYPARAEAERRGPTAVQVEGVMINYLRNRGDVRISDMGSSTYRRDTWMRILIQFATQPDWIDEVRFECYVLFREGNREIMLTGSVTCGYVQAGRRHMTCLFIPPNVLERYGGRPTAVAVECYYQNTAVGELSIPSTTRRWWQEYTGVPDTMVTWFYTPFLRDGIEMYEQVKTGRHGL